jgi:hypothetical protein
MSPLPVSTLGTPRIGTRRELKLALETFWSGKSDETALIETVAALRAANWARQKALGVTVIPSNDFSLHDQVLDTSVMVGAIPEVHAWKGGNVSLETYFAMARGFEARRTIMLALTVITTMVMALALLAEWSGVGVEGSIDAHQRPVVHAERPESHLQDRARGRARRAEPTRRH